MKYDRLYNFISPITGKIADYRQLPFIEAGSIWLGILDVNGNEIISPFNLGTLYEENNPSLLKTSIANPEDIFNPDGSLQKKYVKFDKAVLNEDYISGKEYTIIRGQSSNNPPANSQNLFSLYNQNPLDPNILKITTNATNPNIVDIGIASLGIDYLTIGQLEEASIAVTSSILIEVTGSFTATSINNTENPAKKELNLTFQGLPNNLFLGDNIGLGLDNDALNNIAIGKDIFKKVDFNYSGEDNIAIGNRAIGNPVASILFGIGSPHRNIAIGTDVMSGIIGDDNVAIGFESLNVGIRSSSNVSIGYRSLQKLGAVDFGNILMFTHASSNNVSVGSNSLRNLLTGDDNVSIGAGAMEYVSNGSSLIPLAPSGYIDGSVAIGYKALQGLLGEIGSIVTDGSVAIGHEALSCYSPYSSSPIGRPCIAIGYGALRVSRSGSSNLAIGYRALFYLNVDSTNPLTAESRHIAIGDLALLNFKSSSFIEHQHSNLAIGVEALTNNTDRGNFAIGDKALISNVNGEFIMGIGIYSDVKNDNLINAIAIGPNSKVGKSHNLILGGKSDGGLFSSIPEFFYPDIGIGCEEAYYSLDINNTGENNCSAIALRETNNTPTFNNNSAILYYQNNELNISKSLKINNVKLGGGTSDYGIEILNSDKSSIAINEISNTPNLSSNKTIMYYKDNYLNISKPIKVKNPYFNGEHIKIDVINYSGTKEFMVRYIYV